MKTTKLFTRPTLPTPCLELFKKKNSDYGDAFATYGPIGVLVRMGDKISRLQSITNSKISLINNIPNKLDKDTYIIDELIKIPEINVQ